MWRVGGLLGLGLALSGHSYGGHRSAQLYAGEERAQLRLADGVAGWAEARAGDADSPGGARFDGEWSLVACQMTLLGLEQVIRAHPEQRERYLPAMRACGAWLLTDEALSFGAAAWGGGGLGPLDGRPERAYLGYLNAALGAWRVVEPDHPGADLHDQLTTSLKAGLAADARIWQFQTYPGEVYPADLAVVAGSVALHGRATGTEHGDVLQPWAARFAAQAVDPDTGMLFQALSARDGRPLDHARGSGTALAAYVLAEVDAGLSADLYGALAQRSVLGCGGVREYPPGVTGLGDIDSGPVLLGVSVSATGFAIAGARQHHDATRYRRLVRTSTLFGLPVGGWHLTGGGLGNAIMLAMLTAPPLPTAPARSPR